MRVLVLMVDLVAVKCIYKLWLTDFCICLCVRGNYSQLLVPVWICEFDGCWYIGRIYVLMDESLAVDDVSEIHLVD